jgi:hypothetical protein
MLKKIGLSVLAVPVLLLGLAAHPAQARSHVYVQFGSEYPAYSYPHYGYGYYGYSYAPYYRPGYVYSYPGYYWGGHGYWRHYHHWR